MFLVLALVVLFASPSVSYAQLGGGVSGTPSGQSTFSFSMLNPLAPGTTFCTLIKDILSLLVTIGTPVAALFLVLAGANFVLARGSTDKLNKAKENLKWTIVGIGLFLGAWFFSLIIANTLDQLAGAQGVSICR